MLLALLAYLPGMTGGFVFDDYVNILFNDDLRAETLTFSDLLQAGWSGVAGPLKRPLAMMSFALNFATTGDFVAGFKLTNLCIHLVNGVLLFLLLRLILEAHANRIGRAEVNLPMLAAVATGIWLVHPLNLTSILYVVQRMNSLATLFSLAAMVCYCAGRRRLERSEAGAWWFIGGGVPLFTVFGILSKENAVLTIPLIALLELCFFRWHTPTARDRTVLIVLFAVVLVLPAAAALVYLGINPDYLASHYAGRPFTLSERLFTEARVLWFYLSLLLVPNLGRFGLHHDDYELSTSFVDPLSTAVALGGIGFAIIFAVSMLRRRPLVTFAIGWFLIGHALESSVVALELVHEHRNYLPGVGVILAATYGLAVLFRRYLGTVGLRLLGALVISLYAAVTFIRAGDWSDPITLAVVEAERHPNSFRAVYDLGRIEVGLYDLSGDERHYQNALKHLERSAALDKTAKRPLAALMKLEYAHGREPKPEWKAELQYRYQNTLFHVSETLDLHRIIKCRATRACRFPPNEIVALIQSALSNPSIPPYSKAQLLIDLAVFYVNEAGDFRPAMNLLDDAVDLFPHEFEFRKIRAQIYVMAGRYAEVDDEIRYLRSVSVWRDQLRPPLAAIEALEQRLREARNDGG